ncbi:hypothetical protein BESB_026950 [Besnoitia besnoiti]|uniref:Vacuolar protein sorting-associated protein 54 C-terminal domain-containing protein n=1 Tax=Besnoitia besnoiti TaxID=94643 RepID=A0A2A9M5X8_BESBE|nr:uncharacterized protein BESB_026950 [Besnoitia besnoiti]PFH31721.1 hypothetical protein BESB_026950 [Besnoitia besnoiti]
MAKPVRGRFSLPPREEDDSEFASGCLSPHWQRALQEELQTAQSISAVVNVPGAEEPNSLLSLFSFADGSRFASPLLLEEPADFVSSPRTPVAAATTILGQPPAEISLADFSDYFESLKEAKAARDACDALPRAGQRRRKGTEGKAQLKENRTRAVSVRGDLRRGARRCGAGRGECGGALSRGAEERKCGTPGGLDAANQALAPASRETTHWRCRRRGCRRRAGGASGPRAPRGCEGRGTERGGRRGQGVEGRGATTGAPGEEGDGEGQVEDEAEAEGAFCGDDVDDAFLLDRQEDDEEEAADLGEAHARYTVPECFFSPDFQVHDFLRYELPEAMKVHDQLSACLDEVECNLVALLSRRFSFFVSSLWRLTSMQSEIDRALRSVAVLKGEVKKMQSERVELGLKVLRLTKERQGLLVHLRRMECLSYVRDCLQSLDVLLQAKEFATCLRLIDATRELMNEELAALHVARPIRLQLDELQHRITTSLIEDFAAAATAAVFPVHAERHSPACVAALLAGGLSSRSPSLGAAAFPRRAASLLESLLSPRERVAAAEGRDPAASGLSRALHAVYGDWQRGWILLIEEEEQNPFQDGGVFEWEQRLISCVGLSAESLKALNLLSRCEGNASMMVARARQSFTSATKRAMRTVATRAVTKYSAAATSSLGASPSRCSGRQRRAGETQRREAASPQESDRETGAPAAEGEEAESGRGDRESEAGPAAPEGAAWDGGAGDAQTEKASGASSRSPSAEEAAERKAGGDRPSREEEMQEKRPSDSEPEVPAGGGEAPPGVETADGETGGAATAAQEGGRDEKRMTCREASDAVAAHVAPSDEPAEESQERAEEREARVTRATRLQEGEGTTKQEEKASGRNGVDGKVPPGQSFPEHPVASSSPAPPPSSSAAPPAVSPEAAAAGAASGQALSEAVRQLEPQAFLCVWRDCLGFSLCVARRLEAWTCLALLRSIELSFAARLKAQDKLERARDDGDRGAGAGGASPPEDGGPEETPAPRSEKADRRRAEREEGCTAGEQGEHEERGRWKKTLTTAQAESLEKNVDSQTRQWRIVAADLARLAEMVIQGLISKCSSMLQLRAQVHHRLRPKQLAALYWTSLSALGCLHALQERFHARLSEVLLQSLRVTVRFLLFPEEARLQGSRGALASPGGAAASASPSAATEDADDAQVSRSAEKREDEPAGSTCLHDAETEEEQDAVGPRSVLRLRGEAGRDQSSPLHLKVGNLSLQLAGPAAAALKAPLFTHAKVLLESFHEAKLAQVNLLLENETWERADVPFSFARTLETILRFSFFSTPLPCSSPGCLSRTPPPGGLDAGAVSPRPTSAREGDTAAAPVPAGAGEESTGEGAGGEEDAGARDICRSGGESFSSPAARRASLNGERTGGSLEGLDGERKAAGPEAAAASAGAGAKSPEEVIVCQCDCGSCLVAPRSLTVNNEVFMVVPSCLLAIQIIADYISLLRLLPLLLPLLLPSLAHVLQHFARVSLQLTVEGGAVKRGRLPRITAAALALCARSFAALKELLEFFIQRIDSAQQSARDKRRNGGGAEAAPRRETAPVWDPWEALPTDLLLSSVSDEDLSDGEAEAEDASKRSGEARPDDSTEGPQSRGSPRGEPDGARRGACSSGGLGAASAAPSDDASERKPRARRSRRRPHAPSIPPLLSPLPRALASQMGLAPIDPHSRAPQVLQQTCRTLADAQAKVYQKLGDILIDRYEVHSARWLSTPHPPPPLADAACVASPAEVIGAERGSGEAAGALPKRNDEKMHAERAGIPEGPNIGAPSSGLELVQQIPAPPPHDALKGLVKDASSLYKVLHRLLPADAVVKIFARAFHQISYRFEMRLAAAFPHPACPVPLAFASAPAQPGGGGPESLGPERDPQGPLGASGAGVGRTGFYESPQELERLVVNALSEVDSSAGAPEREACAAEAGSMSAGAAEGSDRLGAAGGGPSGPRAPALPDAGIEGDGGDAEAERSRCGRLLAASAYGDLLRGPGGGDGAGGGASRGAADAGTDAIQTRINRHLRRPGNEGEPHTVYRPAQGESMGDRYWLDCVYLYESLCRYEGLTMPLLHLVRDLLSACAKCWAVSPGVAELIERRLPREA